MIRKLLALVGIGVASVGSSNAAPPHTPYQQAASNQIYNLLFCDDPRGFRPREGASPAHWQEVLFGERVSAAAVEALANDSNAEGRVRVLAYNWLRQNGHSVPAKQLLGVVVEVPLSDGLDVLAAFSDGGVRYINQSGKLAVVEGVPNIQAVAAGLFEASRLVVARIGPWDRPRMPPPSKGNVRLTFLVSDGLYFGEGPMQLMQREPLAGPVIGKATELLQLVVGATTK